MGRVGRPETEEGAQLARYAAARGCTVKTARAHRAARDERWLSFLESDGNVGESAEPELPGAGGELRSRQEMTAAALRQWRANVRGYDEAQRQRCGADTLRKWEGAVSRSQARYEACLAAEWRMKTQLGMLVPMEKVQELKRELSPLALLVRGLKDRIARGIMEPEARQQFYQAFGAAEHAWNVEVEELNRKISALLPCF